MKNRTKTCVVNFISIWMILILISSLLLATSCNSCTDSVNASPHNLAMTSKNVLRSGAVVEEIVLLCGNPGAGKSTLFNTIFQDDIFKTGVHTTTLTKSHQEHVFGATAYIDTPGLADLKRQKEAAREIEAALKKNKYYKILFVIILDAGRVRAYDIAAINKICEAIRQPFEYGLIINKLTPNATQIATQHMDIYTRFLVKKPAATLLIQQEDSVDDLEDVFITNRSTRENLAQFIASLQAHKIQQENVNAIDVSDYIEQAEVLQKALHEASFKQG